MQSNGSAGMFHPPDHTAILLDQTQELRRQSNALGWIMSQLSTGSEVHRELKQGHAALNKTMQEVQADVAQLKASSAQKVDHKPVKFNVVADSIAGLLHAGRPYFICIALLAGKSLGLGPSWIEPLIEKLARALLS